MTALLHGTYQSVDYPDLSGVAMYWDYRSVLSANKLRCLVTDVTVDLERSILSVDADKKLVVADDEWKTIAYSGTAAAMGTNNFAIYMSGVFGALGAAGGYFKVGDSVGTTEQTPNIYGPGVSLRAGGSGIVLDDDNYMTGTPVFTIGLPFTGSAAVMLDQTNDGVYKSFRGTTNASGAQTIAGDPAGSGGSFGAYPWPPFDPKITYGSGLEEDYGPVKNWAHGVALPKNSVINFCCVVAFKDGLPTQAQIDADLDHINNFGKMPPWWG